MSSDDKRPVKESAREAAEQAKAVAPNKPPEPIEPVPSGGGREQPANHASLAEV